MSKIFKAIKKWWKKNDSEVIFNVASKVIDKLAESNKKNGIGADFSEAFKANKKEIIEILDDII